ncbi:MAG: tyrosine-protein phosphatase [Sulfitobacter sp.]
MSPEIYLISDNLPGSLFIMPCPSGDHLSRDIKAYRARGVDVVVSMLDVDEAAELGLSDEADACERVGIAFIHSPIADFGLPDRSVFMRLVTQIAQMLKDGKAVAVHCRAGIGRSGMVTSGALIALGVDAQSAVARITAARGHVIPDTVEQGRFIADFGRRVNQ